MPDDARSSADAALAAARAWSPSQALRDAFPDAFDSWMPRGGPWVADEAAAELPLPAFAIDAWQRGVLFLDLLRQRGDAQAEMTARPMATVLTFEHEVLMSGRALDRPINYSLSRILPPEGCEIDPTRRPVVVVDPRAGQGPGIGGFKTSSEIGDALKNGHAVYFIGFSAKPEPGQTFLDVVEGQTAFFQRVAEMHPDAPPAFAIGNCQAGYQTLMVAMLRPDLFGPVMVAGSPMSYWQGERGKNPMRYSGGLLGGSWLTNLVSDLGQGRFDGTWLILNFDNLNPANWLWGKQFDVYADIDDQAARYLEFERWWGDFIELNGGEIQYLVDELFIGDHLARNEMRSQGGQLFDLRGVETPIIVFTSTGDNISPPPQTLGWILDLYRDVDDLRRRGRTVVYCLNRKVGHLAIFVSSKVGAKEDEEMVRLMDFIDALPPGLFELVIEPVENPAPGAPPWRSRFEMRSFDDIRALGRNDPADDRAFAAARQASATNLALYRATVQPLVKAVANPQAAQAMFDLNPLRLSYTLFASSHPWMKPVAAAAETVRKARRPVDESNPFFAAQKAVSDHMEAQLNTFRDMRDAWAEQSFFAIYGNPLVQAALGVDPQSSPRQPPAATPVERKAWARHAAEMEAKLAQGGANAALLRAVLHVISAERRLDERCADALNQTRQQVMGLDAEAFKRLLKEQHFILLQDAHRERALAALPELLPDPETRGPFLDQVAAIAGADGGLTSTEAQRICALAKILDVAPPEAATKG